MLKDLLKNGRGSSLFGCGRVGEINCRGRLLVVVVVAAEVCYCVVVEEYARVARSNRSTRVPPETELGTPVGEELRHLNL